MFIMLLWTTLNCGLLPSCYQTLNTAGPSAMNGLYLGQSDCERAKNRVFPARPDIVCVQVQVTGSHG